MITTSLKGMQFGQLTAIKLIDGGKWLCKCACGRFSRPRDIDLRSGKSTTCGCGTREAATSHGMSHTKTYRIWVEMRSRCRNPNNPSFHNYGGRGITVCERWDAFENFLADMGTRPDGHDIDRTDNSKGYSPENCRWVTRKVNLRNMRTTNMLTYQGVTRSWRDWAEIYGLGYETLRARLNAGWEPELALNGKKYATLYREMRKPKE